MYIVQVLKAKKLITYDKAFCHEKIMRNMKTMRIGQHILEIEHHGFDIVTTMLNTVFYYLDVEKFSVHYLIQEKNFNGLSI